MLIFNNNGAALFSFNYTLNLIGYVEAMLTYIIFFCC